MTVDYRREVKLARALQEELAHNSSSWRTQKEQSFVTWQNKGLALARRVYGVKSFQDIDFSNSTYVNTEHVGFGIRVVTFEQMLANAKAHMEALVQDLEMRAPAQAKRPRVFIAHGGESAALKLHPKIAKVSENLFKDGHYAQAILEAFISVEKEVKRRSGLKDKIGKDLMAQAFNEANPLLRLNRLREQEERDEQEGFRFIFMGVMQGIRNPKAHDNIVQTDPHRTLEYLGLASLLMRRVDEAKKSKATRKVAS